jgi:type IV secretory pathway VirB4 component
LNNIKPSFDGFFLGEKMEQKIIGICGPKGSGKDTIAEYILRNKQNYRQIAFADPIKKALMEIFSWDGSYFYTDKKNKIDKKYGISPRVAMTTLGTEWGQFILCKKGELFKETIGRKIWVYKTISEIERNKKYNYIISDVRFPHEVEEIRKHNGIIIKIEKSKDKLRFIEKIFIHKSERYFDAIKADFVVNNNSSKKELFEQIDRIELI